MKNSQTPAQKGKKNGKNRTQEWLRTWPKATIHVQLKSQKGRGERMEHRKYVNKILIDNFFKIIDSVIQEPQTTPNNKYIENTHRCVSETAEN